MLEKTVTQALKERYACRKFSDAPIEQEKLEALVQAAEQSPTALNAQELRFRFVINQEKLKCLGKFFEKYYLKHGDPAYAERLKARGGLYFYNAPAIVLISASKKGYDQNTYNLATLKEQQEVNAPIPLDIEGNYQNLHLTRTQIRPTQETHGQDSRRNILFDPSYNALDAGIAVQSLALAADSLGLASCILGSPLLPFQVEWEDKEKLYKSFFLEDEEEVVVALLVGYSGETEKKAPHTSERTQIYFIK